MTKRRIRIEDDFYDVYKTDEYKLQIKETYIYLSEAENEFGYKKYPDDFAEKWLDKINKFAENLEVPRNLGVVDPENFSDTYSHIQVPDTETTVFLLVEGNQIYLATSGWCRLPWNEILKEKQLEIDKQIQELKNSRIENEHGDIDLDKLGQSPDKSQTLKEMEDDENER